MENTLNWNIQIDEVCQKLNNKLNLFKKIKHYLNPHTRMLFYNAYVLPIMDYCCYIWGKDKKTYVNKVNKIQSRIGKIMMNIQFKDNSVSIFAELQILTFNNRCKYHTAVLVYKIVNNMSPSYLKVSVSNNMSYNLRSKSHKDIIVLYRPKTKYFKDTFQHYSMTIWNSIPLLIRNTTNLNSFKNNYKRYLLQGESVD